MTDLVGGDADVAVVGYGPVGMVLTALLGQAGYRVIALERYPGLFHLPRASNCDDETMRTFAKLGVAAQLLPKLTTSHQLDYFNGDRELLFSFDLSGVGRSGWMRLYWFYQPDLEVIVDRVCRGLPNVDVRNATQVCGLVQDDSSVTVSVTGPEGAGTVTAPYVVACDGGNSFVRAHLGIDLDDYGCGEPWMACDFKLRQPVHSPITVCDPQQPLSVVPLGPNHQRVAFLVDSQEDFTDESRPERVWARAADYVCPDNAELIRVAPYTFRSLVARSWRMGRVLLAGDAAHQMPPFRGQGMCSGIRDAQNLAFKLDLVLRGQSADLLDTYQREREPHVRVLIEQCIDLARVLVIRDPVAAAERDRQFIGQRATNQRQALVQLPSLREGFLAAHSGPGRGDLSAQGFVDAGRGPARLDDVIGCGFHLLVHADLLPELEHDPILAALRAASMNVVGIADRPGIDNSVVDVDGTYRRWFAEYGVVAIAVRPDFYVYGTAVDCAATRALAAELLTALSSNAS